MQRFFLVPFALLLAGCELTRLESFALVITLLCWAGFFVYCHNADVQSSQGGEEHAPGEGDDDDDPPAPGGTVLPAT